MTAGLSTTYRQSPYDARSCLGLLPNAYSQYHADVVILHGSRAIEAATWFPYLKNVAPRELYWFPFGSPGFEELACTLG